MSWITRYRYSIAAAGRVSQPIVTRRPSCISIMSRFVAQRLLSRPFEPLQKPGAFGITTIWNADTQTEEIRALTRTTATEMLQMDSSGCRSSGSVSAVLRFRRGKSQSIQNS